MRKATRPQVQSLRCSRSWLLVALPCWAASCQLDEGRDPDRAPDNGLNPQTPATGAPQDKQNAKGPITESVKALCSIDVVAAPRADDQNTASVEVVPAEGVTLKRILIADPKASVYERATLPLVDPGLFTIEVTDAKGQSCYANFGITTTDQDVKVTVSGLVATN